MLIPNLETLYKIVFALKKEFKANDLPKMSIVFEVDEKTLNKVNEDFYYRNNPDADHDNYEIADEVDVNIEGVNFKYIKKEDSN